MKAIANLTTRFLTFSKRRRLTYWGGLLLLFTLLGITAGSSKLLAQGSWSATYWNNRTLTGNPALIRQEGAINHDWGGGSPAPQVYTDNFSAEWRQTASLAAGTYRFSATMDDGMRVFVDGKAVIDSWYDSPVHTVTSDVALGAGLHSIVVQYYEGGGLAAAQFGYALLSGPAPSSVWRGEYFNNTTLSGPPALVRDDAHINFNFGFGSPSPAVTADFFSARWTRQVSFNPARYRCTVISDDGVRFYINNTLLIDQWRVQAAATFSVDVDLAGSVSLVTEYFENTGLAEIRVTCVPVGAAPPPPPPPGTGGPFPGTAVVTAFKLNVRTGPGVSFPIITKLNQGNVVNLAGFRNGASTWVTVALPNGTVGWSSATYLQTSIPISTLPIAPGTGGQPPPPPPSANAVVTASFLNVRFGPGVAYGILATINGGTTVTMIGRNFDSSWVKIILPDGRQGWVNSFYLGTTFPIGNLPLMNI
jgi:uncharacterized protein YgiM (DUF1202 family)